MLKNINKIFNISLVLFLVLFSFSIIVDSANSECEGCSSRARDSVYKDESVLGDFGNTQGTSERIYRDDITTCSGTLSSTGDEDWFRIDLNADPGITTVDNLTITCDSTSAWSWYPLLVVIYGEFENELIILKTVNYWNWGTNPDIFALAYITGTYYIKLQLPFSGSPSSNYQLTFKADPVAPPDYNQNFEDADEITTIPLVNGSVSMNRDIFEWYVIDSPDPDNYESNLSIELEIADSP